MSDSVLSHRNDLLGQPGFVIPLEGEVGNSFPVDENCYSNLRLRSAWQSWLAGREFELSVTLTYDREVTQEAARRDLDHFRRRLYSKVYGKKPGHYLSFVGFLELTKQEVPHWHVLFERIQPKIGESLRQAMARLQHFVRRVWLGMRNTPCSEAGLHSQAVYDVRGLIDYCLKSSDSQHDFDFVEFRYLEALETPQASRIS